jgi:hypothetical protein
MPLLPASSVCLVCLFRLPPLPSFPSSFAASLACLAWTGPLRGPSRHYKLPKLMPSVVVNLRTLALLMPGSVVVMAVAMHSRLVLQY